MERSNIDKYIKYIIIIALFYLAFLIFRPYFTVIITSFIFAFIVYPVHEILRKRLKSDMVSAGLLTFGLVLLIIIPTALIGNIIVNEASDLYFNTDIGGPKSIIESLNLDISDNIKAQLNTLTKELAQYVFNEVSSFLLTIPQKIISFIIMLFVIFYSFKDGKKLIQRVKKAIPLPHDYEARVEKKIKTTLESLLYGNILLSILQWFVATLGFWLIGVNSPALWGMLVGIVALLPSVGPTFIWVPLTIYYLVIGETVTGILIGLFGFLILSLSLDTIGRAKILGIKGKIHPVTILIGVLGGLSAFGLIGLLIGPLILVLAELVVEIYVEEREHKVFKH